MKQMVLDTPVYTIQEVLDSYFDSYLKDKNRRLVMNDTIFKAVNQIKACRTPKLGVYLVGCKCCGDCHRIPRSCKNRFCSKCGNADTMKWVQKVSQKVPDIKHYHFVFTLPVGLRSVCKRNPGKLYNLLFTSSQKAVKEVFKVKGDLLPGLISVLHTNGSDLKYHPHVHMIVSAGGFDENRELVKLKKEFIIAQRALANLYRDYFMSELKSYYEKGDLNLPETYRSIKNFTIFTNKLSSKQWIVNIEDPIKGAEKIIAYVGRYTKKSCISERRILSIDKGRVTISYKDYKNSKRGEKPKDTTRSFTITEFLDRLLQHVPLKGFKVVRYYGMYSSANWKYIPKDLLIKDLNISEADLEDKLETIQEYNVLTDYRKSMIRSTGLDPLYCYHCQLEMSILEVHYEKLTGEQIRIDYETGEQLKVELKVGIG